MHRCHGEEDPGRLAWTPTAAWAYRRRLRPTLYQRRFHLEGVARRSHIRNRVPNPEVSWLALAPARPDPGLCTFAK
ncbi:unnamed protein product [Tetraodon nigroviridis]|uniref:(spotted green pufferfish) hypothetical protein n=1 Tax=Tetraodon nigroviridis TaxID=99883 RepID=Q4T812_TETNG|nr:unnamed protein product [Tetraodon nigroviridis]